MTDKMIYVVSSTDTPPALSGRLGQTPWAKANVATIDMFPWYTEGLKQLTYARLLYDQDAIYVQFLCDDKHISAEVVELNGPVCRDSCVEIFAMFDPEAGPEYFNLEVNCCGAFHLGLGAVIGPKRRLISQELAPWVTVATSIDSETKQPAPDDDGWWVAAAIPFEVLSEFVGKAVKPASGDAWKVNFYRCGGVIDPQFACWAPIDLPAPNFHHHRFFREIVFG